MILIDKVAMNPDHGHLVPVIVCIMLKGKF